MEKINDGLQSVTSHVDMIDFYPITPEYKLRGRSKYTSWLGMVLSLALIIILLVIFILEIIDLANNKDPRIVVSKLKKVTVNDEMVVFTPNATFQMGFNLFLVTSDEPFKDVYVVKSVIRYIDPVTNEEMRQDFILETCEERHFPFAEPPTIFFTRPGELLCFAQEQPPEVGEIYLKTGKREVYIEFYTCFDAGICEEQLFPENNVFDISYISWAVDPLNHTTPVTASYEGMSLGIVKGVQRRFEMSLVTLEFASDEGWLFDSTERYTVINIEKMEQDMSTLDNRTFDLSVGIQGRPFLTIRIMNGGNKIVYSREYRKAFDVFGDITGYYAIILPIMGLIILPYLPYARLKMYEHTANDIYEFRRKKTKKEQKKKGRGKKAAVVAGSTRKSKYKRGLSRSTDAERQNPPSDSSGIQNANQNHLNLSEPQIITTAVYQSPTRAAGNPEHKTGAIHITYFAWLKSLIRPKRKVKLLSQAVKEIEETMDMATIMKRLRDMQNLKTFWFTEEQRILFDSLEKPLLAARTDAAQIEKKFRKSINWGSSYQERTKTPEEAYENINGKEFLTDIDKQLLLNYKKEPH